MIYGVILAGGVGSRMGNREKPKPFLQLGDKPILIHTVEKFYVMGKFDKILVLCPSQWMDHARNLIDKFLLPNDRIVVLEGGADRNETIQNAIQYIEEKQGLEQNTIIVTHDSVRPFVTCRILEENIRCAQEYGACDTVIPATDTIVESKNGTQISAIPPRSAMYLGQTPQSFHAKRWKELYDSLTPEEKEILTDAAKILVMKGDPVHLVNGELFNIKITYPYDLKVAELIMKEDKKEERP